MPEWLKDTLPQIGLVLVCLLPSVIVVLYFDRLAEDNNEDEDNENTYLQKD